MPQADEGQQPRPVCDEAEAQCYALDIGLFERDSDEPPPVRRIRHRGRALLVRVEDIQPRRRLEVVHHDSAFVRADSQPLRLAVKGDRGVRLDELAQDERCRLLKCAAQTASRVQRADDHLDESGNASKQDDRFL